MKKLALIVAAAAVVATAAPALAQSVSVRVGDNGYRHHRGFHERVVVRHDRGWHRGWDRGHHYGWRNHHRHGARVVIR